MLVKVRVRLVLVLVLVYTHEGSLGALYWGVMITQVFLRAMVALGTRTFMCPPRHRAMWLNFLAQGKSLPPAGIELGTFGLQRPWVSHVSHCANQAISYMRMPSDQICSWSTWYPEICRSKICQSKFVEVRFVRVRSLTDSDSDC